MASIYETWTQEELIGELEERDRLSGRKTEKLRQMADLLAERG